MRKYQETEQLLRDNQAKEYEKWYVSSKGTLFDRRERELFSISVKKKRFQNVLDLGSGTGRITETIAPYVDSVVALDFSLESLSVLQSKQLSNVTTIYANASDGLPFKSESFDLVCSCQVIQHMILEDILAVLRECNRVLKPNGQFVFSIYNLNLRCIRKGIFETIEGGLYCKRFSPGYIHYLANKSGFAVKKIIYYKALHPRFFHLPRIGRVICDIDSFVCALPLINRFVSSYMYCQYVKRILREHQKRKN